MQSTQVQQFQLCIYNLIDIIAIEYVQKNTTESPERYKATQYIHIQGTCTIQHAHQYKLMDWRGL